MVTIFMQAREVISDQASPGRWTRGSTSSMGGGPDVRVGGLNPSGGHGNCHSISRGSATPAVTLDLRASFGQTGICRVDACTAWGSRSSPSSKASSAGAREATGFSPADSNKKASQMSSSSSYMRGVRHLNRSWTAPHILPGEPLTTQHNTAGP